VIRVSAVAALGGVGRKKNEAGKTGQQTGNEHFFHRKQTPVGNLPLQGGGII
jgi:hypothetical protein